MVEQTYIDYWKARRAKRIANEKVWAQEAWTDVKAISTLLRERFQATKIVVFGSLAKDEFGEDSDIDIAAEGIPSKEFFPALTAVNRHSKWPVDLKPMESLDPYFKARVLETGKVIDATP